MSQTPVYHNPDGHFTYYAIIPHPHEPCVLALPGWTLPHFTPTEQHFGMVGHINQAMRALLGIEVCTLRCIGQRLNGQQGMRVYALDNLDGQRMPPDAAWLSREQIEAARFEPPELRALLLEYFDWLAEDSPRRVPWSRAGWFSTAAAWIGQEMERLEIQATGPVEQVRAWARSCTLRAPTSQGWLYFKAVPPHFASEPIITRILEQRHPGSIPQVLAMDVDKGWMLMRDFGGRPLNLVPDIAHWETALAHYAEIQRDIAQHVAALVAIGCPDRPVDQLVAQIDRFLGDRAALLPGTPDDLTEAEAAELAGCAHTLKVLCYDLLEYQVPLSLEHGDFWAGNVAMLDTQDYVYFDWSDISITHPFFDMLFFLADIERFFPAVPDARERLLRAYLRPWTDLETIEDLLDAMRIALPLAALHHAMTYHEVILPGIEPRARWEMRAMQPYYLRQLLHLLRRQSDP